MLKKLQKILKHSFSYTQNIIDSISFQAKIIISIILGISIFITISAFFIIQNIQSNIDRQVLLLNNNLKTTQILAQLGAQSIVINYKNVNSIRAKLNELMNKFLNEHPEITFTVFTDNSGNILCKSQLVDFYEITQPNSNKIPPPKNVPFIKVKYTKSGKLLIIAEPLQYNSNFFGWVWIGLPDTGFTIVGSKKELILFLLEIFLLVWVLSVIGAIVNSLIVIQPLIKLEKSAKAITEGRFGFQLPLKGFIGKELTQLAKAFNKMSKRLKQYEESNIAILSSEKNKFESVVMSIADGVIVLDKNCTIQIVNPDARRLLNRSGDELIGQKATNILTKKANKEVHEYLCTIEEKSNLNLNEYATFEIKIENKILRLIITSLYDSNSEKLGAVLVIQDRTKEAEIELIKQEFISNVSHEFRTPITSIKCYVDTLCSHNEQLDTNVRKEFLSIINEETDRLSNLVNDVLELSKLDSPNTKLQLTLQEVYPVIDYSLKAVNVLANNKSIKLIRDVQEDLIPLNINQENFERILINLLSNAIKYTPSHGTVKLSTYMDKNNVVFKIADNGIGIKEEDFPLIFERFYRVENKVHTIKGTGLGLTIVKKSVEQHGGKVTVKSKLGEGSIFIISLPIPEESLKFTKIKQLEPQQEKETAKTA